MSNNIVGIIAEYNPFHNGHKYQLEFAKEHLHADYIIVAMSGNFVQRGAPAIVDKYCRAQIAVAEGADLVFELPACFATGSLDDFALGSVALLDALGIVSYLVFGSESGDILPLSQLSSAMMHDESSYSIIRNAMKTGMSANIVKDTVLAEIENEQLLESCICAINKPNNMLGILYLNSLKRLRSSIMPVTHARRGQGYLDDSCNGMKQNNSFASATAIRAQLLSSLKDGKTHDPKSIEQYIPAASYRILAATLHQHKPIQVNDCWSLLSKAISDNIEILPDISLVTPHLADRISNCWKQCRSWNDLMNCVSTPDISPARVSRCLLHVLLRVTDRFMEEMRNNEICCYARLLSSSRRGEELLPRIIETSQIPVLYSRTDTPNLLPRAISQLCIDQNADSIYKILLDHACY